MSRTDEEIYGEDQLCLGFLEETVSWKLMSKYFPSKVGGKPAWLAFQGIPKDGELCCQTCKQPLAFLCQLYLPNSNYDCCFHRSIFLFICYEGSCSRSNSDSGMRAFRCQLSCYNQYYSSEPPVEDEATCNTPSAQDHGLLCVVCGAPGDKECSQCQCSTYCSRGHQAIHWKDGHKRECTSLATTPGPSTVTQNSFIFPEAQLMLLPQCSIIEKEEEENEEKTKDTGMREMCKLKAKYPGLDLSGWDLLEDRPDSPYKGGSRKKTSRTSKFKGSQGLGELEKDASEDADSTFCDFAEQMAMESSQVIRYHRGGGPLYCSSFGQPGPNAVKNCPHCRQPRQFEFQIQPQMLNHLRVDKLDAPSLDWGVLLVYTCYCDAPVEYVEEQILKQDYAEVAGFEEKIKLCRMHENDDSDADGDD